MYNPCTMSVPACLHCATAKNTLGCGFLFNTFLQCPMQLGPKTQYDILIAVRIFVTNNGFTVDNKTFKDSNT